MRAATVALVLCSACSADRAVSDPPTSVRERLERGETSLAILPAESAGAVAAARRVAGQWNVGLADLAIRDGAVGLSAEPSGAITLERLAIALDPIAIPDSLLGYDVQLTDVELALADPVRFATAWDGDDDGHGDAAVALELSWSLTNHGSTSPLGAPELPPVPIALDVTGNGSLIRAELRVLAPGELWSWADLVRLEDLSLILSATEHSTMDP